MSVNYDLYETPDLTKSGEEQPLHARVVLKGSYTAEEFVEQVTALQHMPHAQVVGIIEAISKELRSPSISLKDINFRVNRQFKKDIESGLELRRYHSPFRVKNPLPEEKCLQRLERFLKEHPCINRQDYALLVGKTKTQALQDINAFIEQGVLKKYGVGRSVVYIKV